MSSPVVMSEVGRIYLLSQGFLLAVGTSTVACRTLKDLAEQTRTEIAREKKEREASRRTNGAGTRREKTIRQSVLLAHNMTRLLTALRNGMIQDWETFVVRLNELVPEEMWVDTDFTNRMLAEWGGVAWTPEIQGAGDLLDTDVEAAYPGSGDVALANGVEEFLDPANDPDLLEGDGPSDEEMALAQDDSHASGDEDDDEGEDE